MNINDIKIKTITDDYPFGSTKADIEKIDKNAFIQIGKQMSEGKTNGSFLLTAENIKFYVYWQKLE